MIPEQREQWVEVAARVFLTTNEKLFGPCKCIVAVDAMAAALDAVLPQIEAAVRADERAKCETERGTVHVRVSSTIAKRAEDVKDSLHVMGAPEDVKLLQDELARLRDGEAAVRAEYEQVGHACDSVAARDEGYEAGHIDGYNDGRSESGYEQGVKDGRAQLRLVADDLWNEVENLRSVWEREPRRSLIEEYIHRYEAEIGMSE